MNSKLEVSTAIMDGQALQYAPEELKNNQSVVLAAVT